MKMIDVLLEPLQYPFMVRGLIAALLVGFVSAIVGTYIVLRGMAFFGNALAHSILPGVALGYLFGGGERKQLFWWALGAALLSSFGISAISQSSKIKEDTAIGIIFAGMFALGIALISSVRDYSTDLTHFLFGDILGVTNDSLILIGTFGIVIILVILALYKEFRLLAFDPVLAATLRLPARFLNYLQLVLIAVAIVVSLQTVGIALMAAMLLTPPATAYLLTRRLSSMMIVASLVASSSGVLGLYLSYYIQISSGAAIVLTATTLFIVVWLINLIRQRVVRRVSAH
jgi:manganese/iron transport system permease protein